MCVVVIGHLRLHACVRVLGFFELGPWPYQELFGTDYPSILYYDQLRTLPAGRRAQDAQQAADGTGKRPLIQHVTVGGPGQSVRPPADAASAAAAAAAAAAIHVFKCPVRVQDQSLK